MFKKFSIEDSMSNVSQIKNSVQRSILNQISEQYPALAECIETLMPKKSMQIGKAADNVQLVIVHGEVLFYNQRDGPFMPTLRLLHKYPSMMEKMQTDKGAIRFILSGSNIMCPGFTSPGGDLPTELDVGVPVAIYAEGKQHAMAVGITKVIL